MSAEIEGLEQQLADAKHLLEQRRLAQKLADNFEFRTLILDQFCTKEAARLVHMSADPAMSAEQRADALAMAQAGGHLRRYLSMAIQMANVAERDIPNIEQAIAEARSEEAQN